MANSPSTPAVKGLDLGTSRIVVARARGDKVAFDEQLNAFVALPHSKMTEGMLQRESISYRIDNDEILAYGNRVDEFANIFGGDTRRPMQTGLLNASEPLSLQMVEMILEEMVGEIYDEYDEPAQQFVEEKPNCFRIESQYLLTDLEEQLQDKTKLPLDRGYDTVGGLLMDLAGRVPLPGEVFIWPKNTNEPGSDDEPVSPQLSFTILAATETTIDTVRMEVLQTGPSENEGLSDDSPA